MSRESNFHVADEDKQSILFKVPLPQSVFFKPNDVSTNTHLLLFCSKFSFLQLN